MMPRSALLTALALAASAACPAPVQAAVQTFNSPTPADNPQTRQAWLNTTGILAPEHRVDFETGFASGQNISGQTGLFPGGLIITDTTGSDSVLVSNGGGFGGSNPVGRFAISHNEAPFLELDLSARPVDYIAFQDIDQSGTSITITFVGGESETVSIETTGASGDSAEFLGIYRHDRPRIARIQLDASGDGEWGIDTIEYGLLPDAALTYTFTTIAGAGERFSAFYDAPAINDAGAVAFAAFDAKAGFPAIFVNSGGVTTTIAQSDMHPVDIISDDFSINNVGTVAFRALLTIGDSGIITGSGEETTVIVSSDPDGDFPFHTFDRPDINASGTVAFRASLRHFSEEGIYTGSGGRMTTIADSTGLFDTFGELPSINDAGTVAFSAEVGEYDSIVTVTADGGLATIADSNGPLTALDAPAINSAGSVAFSAELDAGGEGIFTGNGGPVTTIADTSGPFGGFGTPVISPVGTPAINSAGTVAFYATLDAGGAGIFTGDDPVADQVIQTGDTLFGSTVTDLAFFRGLNDNDDIAFRYTLANGGQGIAVASLSPLPLCPADLAPTGGDGAVGVQDLLALLAAWGPCSDTGTCPADLAPAPGGDRNVGVEDLLALLNSWGACPSSIN